ncbi:MAG: histidine--tRNA ligase [Candidatus Abawacabacteria bacterium RBG_16_42_10]|uniref:Histidine--tRNA ligase n=1 Tax=Candidatus Abawacabacteria bacterium RBG_16_42_10 TaxID=1817814 RepID=A0A1F4XKN1_9BACT|nr:MAG: histidine--tRNA ligase [Candidatus Abawacabacteria bacterium RBG_16_42_10]
MIEARTLQGFSDFLPEDMYLRQYLMDTWRHTFESFGYGALDTPALEYEDILMGKYGEEEKLIYRFTDNGDRKVALRYDQTVPLARAVVQHQNDIKFPFKRYQIGKVWRADSPRKGRKREFYQCDADIIGSVSPLADAEILCVIDQGMKTLGLDDYVINLNHRGILEAMMNSWDIPEQFHIEVFRAIDKFDKIGADGVAKELMTRKVPPDAHKKILELLDWKETDIDKVFNFLEKKFGNSPAAQNGITNLRRITELALASKVDPENIFINLNLVRGLDYYTGGVFEVTVPVFGRTALAAGGRYDKLTQAFSNHNLPGVGVGIGFETLYELLKEHPITFPKTAPEILLVAFSNELLADVSNIAAELRAIGKRVMVYPGGAEKMSKQLKYANDLKIPYVLIFGPDEAKAKKIQLKNMETGESQTIKLDELVNKMSVI